MNAEPVLTKVAKALAQEKLEVIVIGNAGAALLGAPVTWHKILCQFEIKVTEYSSWWKHIACGGTRRYNQK